MVGSTRNAARGSRCCKGVTRVTRVLQKCYKSVARASQESNNSTFSSPFSSPFVQIQFTHRSTVGGVIGQCYRIVTEVLQGCYRSITRVHYDVTSVTRMLEYL
jgi:hypothetical protein